MSIPISFVYGNIVFGERLDDAWAAFSVPCGSYQWLADEAKQMRLAALVGALQALEADVQILRVYRAWDTDGYLAELTRMCSPATLADARHAYLHAQAERLRDCGAAEPALFLLVSLREPERDISSYVSRAAEQHPREWLRSLRRALSMRDRRLLPAAQLESMRVRADQVHARLHDYLAARPARGVELQWLVRRCFCRPLGEPLLDRLHEPRALAFECNGQAVLAPLEADVVRWGSLVPPIWVLPPGFTALDISGRSLLRHRLAGVLWR